MYIDGLLLDCQAKNASLAKAHVSCTFLKHERSMCKLCFFVLFVFPKESATILRSLSRLRNLIAYFVFRFRKVLRKDLL